MGDRTANLDKTTPDVGATMPATTTGPTDTHIAQGFTGQHLSVLPGPVTESSLRAPILSHLLVTDCGYYPKAYNHGFTRPVGAPQTIVIICAAGRGRCGVAGADHAVGSGDVLIIPAGTPHAYAAVPDDPWTIWWMHIAGDLVAETVEAGGFSATAPLARLNDLSTCTALMRDIIDAHEHAQTRSALIAATGTAWRLLALLASRDSVIDADSNPLAGVLAFLEEHPSSHLTLTEMADLAALSPSRFSALFRQSTGMSPVRYQVGQRMRRARELLDLTSTPVAKIAQLLGYDDSFYFSRQFSKEHGMSPREYRRHGKG
jgi:AraC-like DNA-binding protein/uncharacterized RmlC-like cupin family protein